jgi:poly-gamma-glutamate capsule biosynthesis protein CapA/YwtB (metallophosphatase superfamily)
MGDIGIEDTINHCKKYGIEITGAGLTKQEARRIYYKKINQYDVAKLNFSRTEFNEVTDDHGGANPLNLIDNSRDIKEAKNKSDFVFVAVHEGIDVFNLPYPEIVKQMRFYAEMGADLIIMHHSRVISGYEIYKGTPIYYGIGNLIHLSSNSREHRGMIVKTYLYENNKLSFKLIPIELDANNITVSLSDDKRNNQVLKSVNVISEVIQDDNMLNKKWEEYVCSKRALYLSIIEGFPRILFRVAKRMGLIPFYESILLFNKNGSSDIFLGNK